MSGFLEQFNKQLVSGWIKGTAGNNMVRLLFNGQDEYLVEATWKRPDLPDDAIGFIFPLPSKLASVYPLQLECHGSDGEALQNSPRIIETRESEINKVLTGQDGWLFLANDSNDSLAYLTEQKEVSPRLLTQWIELIRSRQDYMSERKTPFIQVVVAEKEVVYQDQLPEGYKISENRPICRITQALEKDSRKQRFLYGPDPNMARDSKTLLYFKGDTHFSFQGAESLTRQLLTQLCQQGDEVGKPRPNPLGDYRYRKAFQVGDLISKRVGTNVELIDYPQSKCKHTWICSTPEPKAGRVRGFHNSQGTGRLLMFHTSSADWMAPFLNDAFRDVLYIWGGELDTDVIDWFQPDYVVAQTNERFLTHCPKR
ncbi:MAG: alginate O-acetyltransferase AlgX-related protein [Prochlorococcaceae cyanobacterium]